MSKENHSSLYLLFSIAFLVIISMSSCANSEVIDPCLEGHQFGFFGGLWHGFIAPIDLLLMLFRDDITVYAQNNNGIWYAFGFVLGSGGWGFLGGRKTKRRK